MQGAINRAPTNTLAGALLYYTSVIWRIFLLLLLPYSLYAASPDVVIVTIDTLRADRVGCYGYTQGETPTLDRLSSEGIQFMNAVSHVPLTRPSHLTIFTGLFPFQHNVHDNVAAPLDSKIPTLAEIFHQQGYATGAFVASFVVNSQSGLQRGFDTYADEFDPAKQPTQFALNLEKRGEQVYREFVTWQSSVKTKPYFAWVHFYDPHFPYEPPPPYSTRFAKRPYDGEIAYTDEILSKLLKVLRPNTLLVVLSDHGESLGEHGENAHSFFIYDSTLRVPMIIRWPGNLKAGTKIDFQTRLVDLFPTILDLLNLPVPKNISGISLKPWMMQSGAVEPKLLSYCETFTPWLHFGWSRLQGVRSSQWKYIEAPKPELYDLAKDKNEGRNLYSRDAMPVRDLRKWLQQSGALNIAATPSTQELDPETLEKLASLGYAGVPTTTPVSHGPAEDPKDKIADFKVFNQTIREGIEAFQAEKYSIAAEKFQLLRDRNIPSFEVHYYLGRSYLRLKSYDKARTELELALHTLPHFLPAYRDLAECWESQGNLKEAEKALLAGLVITPNHPLLVQSLAWFYQRQKQLQKAEDILVPELKEHPDDLESRFRMGAIYRDTGRPELALVQFQEIVKRKPDDPEAHNQLGMLYGATNRFSQAMIEFEKATKLDPKETSYQKNLELAKRKSNQSGADVPPAEHRSSALLRFKIIETKNKAVADVIFKKLQKGENWDDLAKNYSVHPSARSQQPILELPATDVSPQIVQVLSKLKSGEFSSPVQLSASYFLVRKE